MILSDYHALDLIPFSAVQEVDGLVTWSSVLEVFDVSPQDYQPYHCSATNPLGSGSTVLTLRPPSRPFSPTNLTVQNAKWNAI